MESERSERTETVRKSTPSAAQAVARVSEIEDRLAVVEFRVAELAKAIGQLELEL